MYRRALVALDGSEVAETIMPLIFKIAGPLEVTLLRVNVPVRPLVVEGAGQPRLGLGIAYYPQRVAHPVVRGRVRVGRPGRAPGEDLVHLRRLRIADHDRTSVGV